MSYSKKYNEDGPKGGVSQVGQYYHIDKTTVLQQARIFNDSRINNKKCRILLTKIVFLLYTSEPFSVQEATDLFFNVIKLFSSKDTSLRQMMYLVIKELSGIAEDVIMVTQSLIKDIQSKQDTVYRANAIRALCLITDPAMIQGIERILKASIVDKVPSVSSAAIVSSYHLYHVAKDIVKRWTNEVQEAVNQKKPSGRSAAAIYFTAGQSKQPQPIVSNSNISQYHAISLFYLIRQHDKMAVTKTVQQYSGTGGSNNSQTLRNPAAVCMLIRFAGKIVQDDAGSTQRIFMILEGFLRHKNEMVVLEAARAICNIPNIPAKAIIPAITSLQVFLSSPKPTLRFAAIRTLNSVSIEMPASVAPCNLDVTQLIGDQNRSIAIFAITTLLKTGNENSVDQLMQQINGFMLDIADDFKIIVVNAIRSLCLKFPAKQSTMLTFLGNLLRDEGGYSFKKTIVEAIMAMVQHIPQCREAALSQLCEFIEDCEFPKLSVCILHLLGQQGHKMSTPTKYIRYIYNRVILENSIVRAAAVSALVKFGIYGRDASVKQSVVVLLTRCLNDVNDEVRDRATLYLAMLKNEQLAKTYAASDATYPLATLESKLLEYVDSHENAKQFNLSAMPVISRAEEDHTRANTTSSLALLSSNQQGGSSSSSSGAKKSTAPASVGFQYGEKLSSISQFAHYGTLFKSTAAIHLTEEETEYTVSCIKHIFDKHIVFQFDCTNTLNDQVLENVHMMMQPNIDEEGEAVGLIQVADIPADRLEYGVTQSLYVAFEQQDPDDELATHAVFNNTLVFQVKDRDPTTGEADPEGYDDEYQVEAVEVATNDYIRPDYIEDYELLLDQNPVVETFALDKAKAPSLKAACTSLISLLGMQPLEGTEDPKNNNNLHVLLLSGTFLDGTKIACKCRMAFDAAHGVAFQVTVSSQDEYVSQFVLVAIS
ncbi:Non-specific serine/threonine protein kinase [Mucor velutinosus]|uniref:Coatomer subunit gamma n=1 Tax=Mucor velutinosus TaxID=708070 RepID=A0AAN7HKI7_9FUNG|nr:Non-specific serine/threonine protein kinase [Mucor velutinosus]